MCKSLESKSALMFVYHLMCWECWETLLLMRVNPNHHDTVLWSNSLTVSNEALYIHPRALELSTKDRMCNPDPSCWMVRYIDFSYAINSSRFSLKTPWTSGGMYWRHARPLLLYLPMPYFHESEQSVTVG